MTFEEMGLHPDLLKGIHDLGFARPTPVQEESIPPILEGRDVIACAQTGTGKTAAFVLPILHRLLSAPKLRGPRALILAPTRELAQQSMDQLTALSRYVPLRGAAVYGGVSMAPQIKALSAGVELLSATPGRLLDHAASRRVAFTNVDTFVLDEADRMLDMGFLPDLRRIIALLPPKRQNVIMSATIPDEIMGLVKQMCHDPVTVQVGGKHRLPVGIRHAVYPVIHEQKVELLMRLLTSMGEVSSVIIFVRTKERADRLAAYIEKMGIRVAVLHGDRDQRERMQALEAFRSGERQVLVATDVAARGIDIKDVTHVMNYDLPETPESYVHRIGRTGRAEAEGDAFSLMAPEEEGWILAVERMLGQSLPRVTLPDFPYRKPFAAGSYHPRPHYIGDKKPGQRGGFGGRGGGGGGRGGGGFRRR